MKYFLAFNEIVPSEESPVEVVFQLQVEGVTPNCLLCEELVKIAEKRMNKHATKVIYLCVLWKI